MTSVNDARGTSTSSVAVGANAKANVECSEIDASGKLATALRRYLVANHVKTRRTVARRVAKDGLTPLHVAAPTHASWQVLMFALMNWPLGTPGTHKSVVCEPTETGHHFISSVAPWQSKQ